MVRILKSDASTAPRIEAVDPDAFLYAQLGLEPAIFCTAVRKVRVRLQKPPYTVDDYLSTLTRQGLVATVSELRRFAAFI